MPGFFRNNSAQFNAANRQAIAENLLSAAVFFQAQHMQRLNKSFPPASKVGQYPAKRTGHLQASIVYEPESVPEVARNLYVTVGYGKTASYGSILEFQKKRLGLMQTLKDLQPQLSALVGAKVKVDK
jgi:hypothetical protein